MFIEPNTNIRILKNVPLDNSYKNTIYFEDATSQYNYFVGFNKHKLVNQSYQRVNKGRARVAVKAESLYDCNYMMFQNASFGNKWFYAFITSVEYVNNTVSEITFEIDVLQTWLLDCTFKECFIEREHVMDDRFGVNTVPENLETGEYVTDTFLGTGHMGDYACVVASTFDASTGRDATGYNYNGIYSALKYNVFDSVDELDDFMDSAIADRKSEGIVSVFMMPKAFCGDSLGYGDPPKGYDIAIDDTPPNYGFTPNNNKLFTHPYNFLYVSNLDGQSAVFRYELFIKLVDKYLFRLVGDFSCTPSVVLYPKYYRGASHNMDEKLTISGFPQCAYDTDTFKAWCAQQGPSLGIGLVSGVLASYMAMTNPVIASAVAGASLISGVGSILSKHVEREIQPPQARGGTSSNTLVALKQKDFCFMKKHILPEYAKIIDRYFDMYGYATHRTGIPNISGRPCWNYVKTVGCTIVGGAPADDIAKICRIHDNGVTYWKPNAVFGVYDSTVNDNRCAIR